MIVLKYVKINKLRHVRVDEVLTFSDGANVLLGKNGTGKTTMLNLVSAMVGFRFQELPVGSDL